MNTAPLQASLDLLAAIVRGDRVPAGPVAAAGVEMFEQLSARHGVLALVAYRLLARTDLPPSLLVELRARATEAATLDLLREAELKATIADLVRHDVVPIVMKGSALAYSHYPRPDLRPRIDCDVIIPVAARPLVESLLKSRGYAPRDIAKVEMVMHQAMYVKRRGTMLLQAVDVHWKIANPQPFADLWTYEDFAARSLPLDQLAAGVRRLGDVDALLLACVHRVAHHFDTDNLIWLYDIDLIARRLTADQWEDFFAQAIRRKIAAVCRRSLERTAELFPSDDVTRMLAAGRLAADGQEPTARYLEARRHAGVVLDDLLALSGWRDRWRLMREHLLPPPEYLRAKYAPGSSAPLAVLYMQRLVLGAVKWLRKPGTI